MLYVIDLVRKTEWNYIIEWNYSMELFKEFFVYAFLLGCATGLLAFKVHSAASIHAAVCLSDSWLRPSILQSR